MRIETREYKVYQFKELSDEVKEKVIARYYEHEDYPFLEEDIMQEAEQLDEAGIFKDIKLQYSLSCCQGDGLSFSAEINLRQFIDKVSENKQAKRRINALDEYCYKVYSRGNNGHYCYAAENQIDMDLNYGDKELKRLEALLEAIIEEIRGHYVDICKKLEKYGYSILSYRMNNEEFLDHCEANDYEFLENGKMF